MRAVLDASAAANIVLRTALAPQLIATLEQCSLVAAPALFHSEITNTLWKYVRAGEFDQDTAQARLAEAVALIDVFVPDEELTAESLAAAVRYKHPVYDLLYLVLARRRGCKIVTADKRLAALAGQMDKALLP